MPDDADTPPERPSIPGKLDGHEQWAAARAARAATEQAQAAARQARQEEFRRGLEAETGRPWPDRPSIPGKI